MSAITRRQFAMVPAAGLAAGATMRPAFAQSPSALITRAIPVNGEPLPAVGLGTAEVFDTDDAATRQSASAVIQALVDNGGTLIDTASTYGDAERVIGDVTAPTGLRNKLFIATKLESPDGEELKRSLRRLQTEKVDLLQLHNVSDPKQSLAAFNQWKARGLCRYIGITWTFHGAFRAVEAVLACKSTTPSTTAKLRSAFCRLPPTRAPRCSLRFPLAADVYSAPCEAKRFPIGPRSSPRVGRNSFSNICSATRG